MAHTIRMLWLIVVFAAALPAQSPTNHKEDGGPTQEDYGVYSGALRDLYKGERSVLLIDQTSAGIPPGMAAVTHMRSAADELFKQIPEAQSDLDSRNKTSVKVDTRKIKVAFDIVSLSPEQAQKQLQAGGWKSFHNKYPGVPGITLISRPGFSMGHDRALLYVGTSCDTLCGNGFILLLGKQGPYWNVLEKARVWIS